MKQLKNQKLFQKKKKAYLKKESQVALQFLNNTKKEYKIVEKCGEFEDLFLYDIPRNR